MLVWTWLNTAPAWSYELGKEHSHTPAPKKAINPMPALMSLKRLLMKSTTWAHLSVWPCCSHPMNTVKEGRIFLAVL